MVRIRVGGARARRGLGAGLRSTRRASSPEVPVIELAEPRTVLEEIARVVHERARRGAPRRRERATCSRTSRSTRWPCLTLVVALEDRFRVALTEEDAGECAPWASWPRSWSVGPREQCMKARLVGPPLPPPKFGTVPEMLAAAARSREGSSSWTPPSARPRCPLQSCYDARGALRGAARGAWRAPGRPRGAGAAHRRRASWTRSSARCCAGAGAGAALPAACAWAGSTEYHARTARMLEVVGARLRAHRHARAAAARRVGRAQRGRSWAVSRSTRSRPTTPASSSRPPARRRWR